MADSYSPGVTNHMQCAGCGHVTSQSSVLAQAFSRAIEPLLDAIQPDPRSRLKPPQEELSAENVNALVNYVNWATNTVRNSDAQAWDDLEIKDMSKWLMDDALANSKLFAVLLFISLSNDGLYHIEGVDIMIRHIIEFRV